jgi:hypothetical protein
MINTMLVGNLDDLCLVLARGELRGFQLLSKRKTGDVIDDGATLRAASLAARAIRLRMEAEHVPDGPEYDAAVAADFDALDAILDSRHADDDRFFADAAHMIELANGDQQEEASAVTLLKNYLKQRSANMLPTELPSPHRRP